MLARSIAASDRTRLTRDRRQRCPCRGYAEALSGCSSSGFGDCLRRSWSSRSSAIAAALLTGGTEAQGRGTIGDDVRDATSRVPILWFQETDPHPTPRQRFHIDVQVPYDVAEPRIAAAVAAGAVIVDDSRAPSTTVIADPDGNKACVGTFQPPPQPE